jgi:hypothetical protein
VHRNVSASSDFIFTFSDFPLSGVINSVNKATANKLDSQSKFISVAFTQRLLLILGVFAWVLLL